LIHRDPKLLKAMAEPGECAWCRQWCAQRDCHHIYSKGAGRVDIAGNLVSLCRVCHALTHSGAVSRFDLLTMAANREGLRQDEITAAVYAIRRHPKHLPLPEALRRYTENRP
jgi:hypothetical protein